MEPCPRCGSDEVRRVTETDLACAFCGHEWLDPLPPDDDEARDRAQGEQTAGDTKTTGDVAAW